MGASAVSPQQHRSPGCAAAGGDDRDARVGHLPTGGLSAQLRDGLGQEAEALAGDPGGGVIHCGFTIAQPT